MTKKKEAEELEDITDVKEEPKKGKNDFKGNFFDGININDDERAFFKLSPSIDIVLGGGLMSGQFVELSGAPKIGKSSAAIYWAKSAIEQGYHVYVLDVEQRLRKSLMDIVGINKDNLTVVKSIEEKILMGEDYLTILENLIKDTKKSFFIVDSIPALRFETGSVGELAKKMTEFIRKVSPIVDVKNQCVILLNHEKQAINMTGYGPKTYTSGGVHIKYQSSTIISVAKMATLKTPAGLPYGHTVLFKIKCSPTTGPCEGKINLLYGKGFDINDDIVQLALELGVIDMKGSWFTVEGESVQGRKNVIEHLVNKNLIDEILKKCYKICEIK